MPIHPAVWIAAWCVVAIGLQRLELPWLAVVSAPTFLVAVRYAGTLVWRLLNRARWLFLAIVILFVAATPGERLPGVVGAAGISYEGLQLASENLLRLVLLFATLAFLSRLLGRNGALSGLHCLLTPLGSVRERIVVRLMLTLELVEEGGKPANWRTWLTDMPEVAGDSLNLTVAPLRTFDRIFILLALAGATGLTLL